MAITQKDKPIFFTDQKSGVATRANGDGAATLGSNTNTAAIYTGATTYGSMVTALLCSTDDTTAGNAYIFIYNGSSVRPLGIVNIPIQSGDLSTVAAVDLLNGSGVTLVGLPRDAQGKQYIMLDDGEVLKVGMKAAPTAAKTFHFTALVLDGTA